MPNFLEHPSHVSREVFLETTLAVQRLRHHAPSAGVLSLIAGQGTRSHMPRVRICMLQLQIPRVATKTQHSLHKLIFKKERKKRGGFWCNTGSPGRPSSLKKEKSFSVNSIICLYLLPFSPCAWWAWKDI